MSKTPHSVLIAEEQIHAAGEVLARAFFNDPLCAIYNDHLAAIEENATASWGRPERGTLTTGGRRNHLKNFHHQGQFPSPGNWGAC